MDIFLQLVNQVYLANRPTAIHNGLELLVEMDPGIDKIGGTFVSDEL